MKLICVGSDKGLKSDDKNQKESDLWDNCLQDCLEDKEWDEDHALDMLMNGIVEDLSEENIITTIETPYSITKEFDKPNLNNDKMKILYVDLDGVVADFDKGKKEHPLGSVTPYKGRPDKLPGVYENLDPIENSIESVNKLLNNDLFDVYFLSTAPWDNPDAWTHKRLWIAKYFDEKLIRKRLILCHHKQLMIGDYLIDDRRFNGASEFKGEWIHFGSEDFPNWNSVLKYLNVE